MTPWTGQIQISEDGNVNLCCSAGYSLGNVFEKSLEMKHRFRSLLRRRWTARDDGLPMRSGEIFFTVRFWSVKDTLCFNNL